MNTYLTISRYIPTDTELMLLVSETSEQAAIDKLRHQCPTLTDIRAAKLPADANISKGNVQSLESLIARCNGEHLS